MQGQGHRKPGMHADASYRRIVVKRRLFAGFHTVVPYPGQRRHHATCKPPHHIPGRRLCQGTPGDKLMSGRLAEVPPEPLAPKQMPRTAETLTTTTKEANSRFLTDCYL